MRVLKDQHQFVDKLLIIVYNLNPILGKRPFGKTFLAELQSTPQ